MQSDPLRDGCLKGACLGEEDAAKSLPALSSTLEGLVGLPLLPVLAMDDDNLGAAEV